MRRGAWIRVPLALSVLAVASGCGADGRRDGPERIILIVVDTLRQDHVSTYGGSVETPRMDRLAARGRVFDNAVSAFHSTTMSMAALFSGRTPSIESGSPENALEWNTFASCGMARFAEPESAEACVPDAVQTLAEDLSAAGYYTMGVVSNKLLFRPYGFDQGFEDWIEVGGGPDGAKLDAFKAARIRTAEHVNRDVARALAKRKSDRFFLYVHYIDVHDWILFRISYAESVRRFDSHLGTLIDLLESEDLLEDTALVFTSDHGEMLGPPHLGIGTERHFGNPSFEPLLRVPLFVSPPDALDGSPFDAAELVRSQDVRGIVRWIAGLGGEPAPDLASGELFVTEQFYQTYRRGSWKSNWQRGQERVLLFDLESDPGELEDLSRSRPEILTEHRQRIDQLTRELSMNAKATQDLDEEALDRLRALGYLDEARAPEPEPEKREQATPDER